MARAQDEQQHTRAEQRRGRCDDERGDENSEKRRRRAFLAIRLRPPVVAHEPPARCGRFQQHRRNQEHAEEDMERQVRVQEGDRRPLRRQQHEQHRPREAGQTLVPFGTAAQEPPQPRIDAVPSFRGFCIHARQSTNVR